MMLEMPHGPAAAANPGGTALLFKTRYICFHLGRLLRASSGEKPVRRHCHCLFGLIFALFAATVALLAMQHHRNPYRYTKYRNVFPELYERYQGKFQPEREPEFHICTGGCIDLRNRRCLGSILTLYNNNNKNQGVPRGWNTLDSIPKNTTTTAIGTLLAVENEQSNINDVFHDTFWQVLVCGYLHRDDDNNHKLTILYHFPNLPRIKYVLSLGADLWGWNLRNAEPQPHAPEHAETDWVYASSSDRSTVYIVGRINRNLRL